MSQIGQVVPTSRGADPKSAPLGVPRRKMRRDPWNLLFIAPWFIGLIAFTAGPVLAALGLSFTDYNLLRAPKFVGIANYERILTDDPKALDALGVTFLYVVASVPLTLAAALLLAIALNKGLRLLGLYRAVFYLPSLLGGSVAIAVMWRQVFGTGGLFNSALNLVGIEATSNWIASPETAPWTLIALHVWQFGSPLVIFLAGLKQIPSEYYEAASLDGANVLQKFTKITIPMLSAVTFFNLVMQTIGAFQAFSPAYIVSNGTGGPLNSTLFYTLYIYQEGFTHFRMGYASALAWILLILIAVSTSLFFWSAKKWVHYS